MKNDCFKKINEKIFEDSKDFINKILEYQIETNFHMQKFDKDIDTMV
jgi:hypothetical protein